MSRSGYSDEWDNQWRMIIYRGAVKSAIRGRRGQAFLKEMLAALDALPEKKLIAHELVETDGAVCALGAVGKVRGMDMTGLDPEEAEAVAKTFGVATAFVREVTFENDDDWGVGKETPEARYARMRRWIEGQIIPVTP